MSDPSLGTNLKNKKSMQNKMKNETKNSKKVNPLMNPRKHDIPVNKK